MRVFLVSLAIVWGASLVGLLVVAAAALRRPDEGRDRAAEPRADGACRRRLTPSPGADARLLVAWSAVRSSKRRLGVDDAALGPETEAAPTRPRRRAG